MTPTETLDSILSVMAYERGHSAGDDEVMAILTDLKFDMKPVYSTLELVEALQTDNAVMKAALKEIANPDKFKTFHTLIGVAREALAQVKGKA